MDDKLTGSTRISALQQFKMARRNARIRNLLSRLAGRSDDLLLFDEVRQALALTHPKKEELRDIPLDAIVGTVSRYKDFNRQFNPMRDSDEQRWARVKELMETTGLEPIEVYQVDDIYFVLDGNHRVSVSRHLDAKSIQAYVKEFRTDIDLEQEDNIEDVVLKAEWAELMADTALDVNRPDVEIRVTIPGRYAEIREHIEVHRYYLNENLSEDEELSLEEASLSWLDNVYCPAVKAIREHNSLKDFPGRTETDLYLWLKKHQWELEHDWRIEVPDGAAVENLASQFGQRFRRRLRRIWRRVTGRRDVPPV
jgi:hypothetical protein